jgi:hypothetical protein
MWALEEIKARLRSRDRNIFERDQNTHIFWPLPIRDLGRKE